MYVLFLMCKVPVDDIWQVNPFLLQFAWTSCQWIVCSISSSLNISLAVCFIRCHWLCVVCCLDAGCSRHARPTSPDIPGREGLHRDLRRNQTSKATPLHDCFTLFSCFLHLKQLLMSRQILSQIWSHYSKSSVHLLSL